MSAQYAPCKNMEVLSMDSSGDRYDYFGGCFWWVFDFYFSSVFGWYFFGVFVIGTWWEFVEYLVVIWWVFGRCLIDIWWVFGGYFCWAFSVSMLGGYF